MSAVHLLNAITFFKTPLVSCAVELTWIFEVQSIKIFDDPCGPLYEGSQTVHPPPKFSLFHIPPRPLMTTTLAMSLGNRILIPYTMPSGDDP